MLLSIPPVCKFWTVWICTTLLWLLGISDNVDVYFVAISYLQRSNARKFYKVCKILDITNIYRTERRDFYGGYQ